MRLLQICNNMRVLSYTKDLTSSRTLPDIASLYQQGRTTSINPHLILIICNTTNAEYLYIIQRWR